MAQPQAPTTLLLQPKYVVTRYNRVLLYGAGILCTIIGMSWVFVMATRSKPSTWESQVRLVSSAQPLVLPEKPTPPPPTPPPSPALPPVMPAALQHFAPPPVRKECEECRRRREALWRALHASVKVENFSLEEAPHGQPAAQPVALQPQAPGQVMEVPPVWQPGQPQPVPGAPRVHPFPQFPQREEPWPVGRSQQFWAQSSYGTTGQWLTASVQPPRSPYQVNAGTVIPAVVAQALDSDLEGTVTALVTQDVFDSIAGQYLVIPQGSWLFGFYDADVRGNVPRLHLAFKTLYFPNGYSLALSGMPGVDGTGMAGVSDAVNRHLWQRYGSAAVLSLITAGISLATYTSGGLYTYSPSDAARYGAGQVMGQAVGEELRQAMRIRPTLTVAAGYPFNLMITQDLALPGPYPFAQVQFAQGGE